MSNNVFFNTTLQRVKSDPATKISVGQLNAMVNEGLNLDTAEKAQLIASSRIHNTLFFERIVRSGEFSLSELMTLHSTSLPGGTAVVKNINKYADKFNESENGPYVLNSILKPIGRASTSQHVRSTKSTVSAFTTREGMISLISNLTPEFNEKYVEQYDKTPLQSVVDYIISVYAQEIYLSPNDKNIVLPRLAKVLNSLDGGTAEVFRLTQYLDGNFNFKLFAKA